MTTTVRDKIVTIGEIVVEIMAEQAGFGFREPLVLRGPFPSGAPAIFIDQVAHLDQACGLISCVGQDDFGTINIERLQRDGVDVSAIQISPDHATGSAFVRYRPDGERDFVYNIRNAACGQTHLTEDAMLLLDKARHFHVMGSSLFSFRLIDAATTALRHIKKNGGTISFDPNIRKEMLDIPEMRSALEMMLHYCDIFLPSGPELMMLTEADTEDEAIKEILDFGVQEIVVKRGRRGASYHDAKQTFHLSPFHVEEIDPTGAGDCFGATFVTCRLKGYAPLQSLEFAAASGARAVSVRGPMEGTSTFGQLESMIRLSKETAL